MKKVHPRQNLGYAYVPDMTYNVFDGTVNLTQTSTSRKHEIHTKPMIKHPRRSPG